MIKQNFDCFQYEIDLNINGKDYFILFQGYNDFEVNYTKDELGEIVMYMIKIGMGTANLKAVLNNEKGNAVFAHNVKLLKASNNSPKELLSLEKSVQIYPPIP